jgi:hypothetical protein
MREERQDGKTTSGMQGLECGTPDTDTTDT